MTAAFVPQKRRRWCNLAQCSPQRFFLLLLSRCLFLLPRFAKSSARRYKRQLRIRVKDFPCYVYALLRGRFSCTAQFKFNVPYEEVRKGNTKIFLHDFVIRGYVMLKSLIASFRRVTLRVRTAFAVVFLPVFNPLRGSNISLASDSVVCTAP